MEPEEPRVIEPSSTGLEPRLAAVLSYLFGFVSGIIFLILERENQYVRFHAMQSTVTFISLFVIRVVAEVIPFIGNGIESVISLVSLVIWAFLMWKAWLGERYMLPMIGEMADERTRVSG